MGVVIVDSGCANVASVAFALERLGVTPRVSSEVDTIRAASHVVLPGVGTASSFMEQMKRRGLVECLRELTQPCLGICLGMQLMFEASEEGPTRALGVFPGRIAHLPAGDGLTIPHMGWNELEPVGASTPLLKGVQRGDYVYFVHSYFAAVSEHTIATARHGVSFTAVLARENFFGCQFHPERSGRTGTTVLRNFLNGP